MYTLTAEQRERLADAVIENSMVEIRNEIDRIFTHQPLCGDVSMNFTVRYTCENLVSLLGLTYIDDWM